MLQVDPREVGRLAGLVKNLEDRLAEAEMYGWGGEIVGIKASLEAGREKLARVRRTESRPRASLVDLGIPVIAHAVRPQTPSPEERSISPADLDAPHA